jgi:hypothetical protein
MWSAQFLMAPAPTMPHCNITNPTTHGGTFSGRAGAAPHTGRTDMNLLDSTQGLPLWLSILLAVVAVLILSALVNHAVARWAERRHPPEGEFLAGPSHDWGPEHP